jgi:hypothetical protein
VNLTSEGTADWADWGLSSPGSFDHKASGNAQLSSYTLVGGATAGSGSLPLLASWSDGTPDSANGGTGTGVSVNRVGGGFTLHAPADGTLRTLHLYVGVHVGQGIVTATLSDGSAARYSDSMLYSGQGTATAEYTFTYRAGSAGQTLNISLTMLGNYGAGYIVLKAATLG